MKATDWTGPRGNTIYIGSGSRKPPAWMLNMIDRILDEHSSRTDLSLRYIAGRGGGYAYGSGISIHTGASDRDREVYVVAHEMAHICNVKGGKPHGDGFHEALVRIAPIGGHRQAVPEEPPEGYMAQGGQGSGT